VHRRDHRDLPHRLAPARLNRYAAIMVRFAVSLIAALLSAAPAAAALPDAARTIIDAAILTGDKAKVAAVADVARAAFPADRAEIDQLQSAFDADQAKLAAARERERLAKLRSAGPLDLWKGRGELSGFRATGNGESTGVSGALAATRTGIDWSHTMTLRADLQSARGTLTRDYLMASWEPRYQIDKGVFAYGLTQLERNRVQGIAMRYVVSGGLGVKVIDDPKVDLAIKAGPTLRGTRYLVGESEDRIAGLFGLNFDWRFTDTLKLTQTANAVAETGASALAIVDGHGATVNLVTGLEAKVTDRLNTRVSYSVDYDSQPAFGKVSTDTMTRFGIVYGF
jgi:putative salt-induced outer membrane protein